VNRYGRNGNRTCTCGHFLAAHQYDGSGGPPAQCVVPGCGCAHWHDRRQAQQEKRDAAFTVLLAAERRRYGLGT
jgi:hypothetical protein